MDSPAVENRIKYKSYGNPDNPNPDNLFVTNNPSGERTHISHE